MADSKKYDGSQWAHSLRKLTTATETIQSGDTIYANGQPITTYMLKGNEEHTGTPSPQNPVMPNGVGNKTANLYNAATVQFATGILNDNGEWQSSTSSKYTTTFTEVDELTTYTLSRILQTSTYFRLYFYDNSKNWISRSTPWHDISLFTFTTPANCKYIQFQCSNNDTGTNWMLNTGSTAQSYEPYGYKIPILNGQQTTNIYLGSTQSTRQIKKLVLDGTENWSNTYGTNLFDIIITPLSSQTVLAAYCSHYVYNPTQSGINSRTQNGEFALVNYENSALLAFKNTSYSNPNEFKAWVAAQYTAGTPVTLYYVLRTPETGTVNEPLIAMGTAYDSISNATAIPTTDGANSITVDTTVQPSEFTATWTGWHDSSVKEYDGADWQ